MKTKSKKIFYILLLIGCSLLGYYLWISLRPVEIVAVHGHGSHSDVLVKNFPLTDQGKINWWLEHKNQLQRKYNIPKPEKDGGFVVIFWLFGEGYKETDGYDRLCFDDMSPPLNCIDKEAVFAVDNSVNMGTIISTYEGEYRIKKNGKIVKYEPKFTARAVD